MPASITFANKQWWSACEAHGLEWKNSRYEKDNTTAKTREVEDHRDTGWGKETVCAFFFYAFISEFDSEMDFYVRLKTWLSLGAD